MTTKVVRLSTSEEWLIRCLRASRCSGKLSATAADLTRLINADWDSPKGRTLRELDVFTSFRPKDWPEQAHTNNLVDAME